VNISVDATGYEMKVICSNSSRDFTVLIDGRTAERQWHL
jgi:hypothetical protein